VADTYVDNAQIKQVLPKPYMPGSILVRRAEMSTYTNSIHEGYDDLNKLERPFAAALDALDLPWARTPAYRGYWLPLLSIGTTTRFFPDFVLWNGDEVLLLETKGEHLIQSEAGRKLLSVIPDARTGVRIGEKLRSPGKWSADGTPGGKEGFSLWGLRQDQKMQVKHFDDLDALVRSLVNK
jgi:type III restriction enzyme